MTTRQSSRSAFSALIIPPRAAGMKTSHGIASRSSGGIASAPSNSATLPPRMTCSASAFASIPSSARIAPNASEAPTMVHPSCCMMRAAHEPTFP
jgi:hypothetical protein